MGILDNAIRWSSNIGKTKTSGANNGVGEFSTTRMPNGTVLDSPNTSRLAETYENTAKSKLGRAIGAVGAGVHGMMAADAFGSGDPYKLAGHGLMSGLNAFAPTRPFAMAADALTGGKAAETIGSGMRKVDEFAASVFDNERAKTRLGMAGPAQMPAATTEQQAPLVATPTTAPADGAKQADQQVVPAIATNAPATVASAPVTLGNARRELPQLPKFDFTAPKGDRTGFGLAMKLLSQQPQALQYARDAKNERFGFQQDQHADDVALKKRALDIEQAKNDATIEANKHAKLVQQAQQARDLDDKRMKQFMEDTNIHTISHTDKETGKVSQISDDVKNNDFRNFIRQYGGTDVFDRLTEMPSAQRQKAIAAFKQMYDLRDKVNAYASERGGVTTSGPIGLGKARDYSFARDVLNPGGVGLWTYLRNGGFLDRANNPQVVDTTIDGVEGQSIPVKELMRGEDGTVNADYLNLLRQTSLSNAIR